MWSLKDQASPKISDLAPGGSEWRPAESERGFLLICKRLVDTTLASK